MANPTTTYAVHKPRGVLSAAGATDDGQRTLTDVMRKAGVAPIPGHVGRLDAQTSGLILVTNDSSLYRAISNTTGDTIDLWFTHLLKHTLMVSLSALVYKVEPKFPRFPPRNPPLPDRAARLW